MHRQVGGRGEDPRAEDFGYTYVVIGQKVERTEDLIILEVERPGGLKVPPEGGHSGSLYNLLGAPRGAELLVVVAGRKSGSPPRPSTVVIVGSVVVEVRRMVHVVIIHGCHVVQSESLMAEGAVVVVFDGMLTGVVPQVRRWSGILFRQNDHNKSRNQGASIVSESSSRRREGVKRCEAGECWIIMEGWSAMGGGEVQQAKDGRAAKRRTARWDGSKSAGGRGRAG